jgi:flagellar basal body-associated protein FliL
MSTTPPAPPPGPPPAPPPSPPSAPLPGATPGAAPARKSGGGTNIWLVLFIVAGVLFVGALIFAIFSFTGKSSAEDDKDKAQKELASTKKELSDTQGELGTQQGAGEILGDLVRTGETSASDLKACADSARQLRSNIVDALNAVQAGTGINDLVDGINAQINQNDNVCNTSDTSYQSFIDALEKVLDQ